jgi:hypothetical protein
MRERIDEFWVLVDHSKKLEYSIVLAMLAPAIILCLGVWAVDSIVFAEPFRALGNLVRGAFGNISIVLACLSFVQFATAAFRHYRRARRQVFGI